MTQSLEMVPDLWTEGGDQLHLFRGVEMINIRGTELLHNVMEKQQFIFFIEELNISYTAL
jgi:hypothetical protein